MSNELDQFYLDFTQEILSRAEANMNFSESVFVDTVADRMIDAGEIDNFDYCHYKNRGLRVDGYSFVDDEGLLNLFVAEYRRAPTLEILSKTDVTKIIKRVENFFTRSLDAGFHEAMEETSDGFKLAYEINNRQYGISKVRFYLLTDTQLSGRVYQIDSRDIKGYDSSFHIWDISRLHRLDASGKGHEDVEIDFVDLFGDGIACLPAHLAAANYRSFLAVMPGVVLSSLYDRYGQRLLEQNVRTFLQFRGNVNKGIRNTILNDPEMFFAYNNGITATAENVVLENGGGIPRIHKVTNLQIVNGGQTTASIFGASTKDKADLDKIFVQMKLSVIEPERAEEVVPKISEYANSQNRVNAADFFSNHPFHIKIENMSRRIWAPSREGTQKESHWFYERARGQYANAQVHMTPAKKKEFLLQNPRCQMFTKTDLAKFENTWSGIPHIVSLGAQKNFAKYASEIGKRWDKDQKQFNELYFKVVVAKAIMFRSTEKLVMQQSWYSGGYRANIVTYTLALMSSLIEQSGKSLNYQSIWKKQSLSDALEKQIAGIAKYVHDIIQDTPPTVSNVTEWCKKQACWAKVQDADIKLDRAFMEELVSKELAESAKKDARKIQVIDDGIEAQTKVIELCNSGLWMRLNDWNYENKLMTEKEQGLVSVANSFPNKIPSEKQSIKLIETLARMEMEGFPVDV